MKTPSPSFPSIHLPFRRCDSLAKTKSKAKRLSKHAYQAIAAFTVSLERVATQRIFCALSLQLVLDNKENLLSWVMRFWSNEWSVGAWPLSQAWETAPFTELRDARRKIKGKDNGQLCKCFVVFVKKLWKLSAPCSAHLQYAKPDTPFQMKHLSPRVRNTSVHIWPQGFKLCLICFPLLPWFSFWKCLSLECFPICSIQHTS